ncbi:MAG: hypothetical protein JW768_16305 [Chitinispirillaceae bacterium]|nr:hypothetical protein [Chitinispirillaceae bacterium]
MILSLLAMLTVNDTALVNTDLLALFGKKETWQLEQLHDVTTSGYPSVNHANTQVNYYIVMELPGPDGSVLVAYVTALPASGASAVEPATCQHGMMRAMIRTAAP